MTLRFAIYDLDETLYPLNSGLMDEMRERMTDFVQTAFNLSREQAVAERRRLWKTYGTTFAGLRQEHPEIDAETYLTYVHNLPVESYLSHNQALRQMLLGLPLRRVVFTNATLAHANRVLQSLGLSDCFERIFDTEQCGYVSKPNQEAFQRLLAVIQADGNQCVMVEDSVPNLQTAKALGMITILAHPDAAGPWDWVDYQVTDALETGPIITRLALGEALPIHSNQHAPLPPDAEGQDAPA